MHYLDANVFIYAAVGIPTDKKTVAATELLRRVVEGRMHATTSLLSWDEFVWVLRKIEGKKVAREKGRKILHMPNLKWCGIDGQVVDKAQELVERYDIKPRDALHAASAIRNGIREFVTDDTDFDAVTEIRRIAMEKSS